MQLQRLRTEKKSICRFILKTSSCWVKEKTAKGDRGASRAFPFKTEARLKKGEMKREFSRYSEDLDDANRQTGGKTITRATAAMGIVAPR